VIVSGSLEPGCEVGFVFSGGVAASRATPVAVALMVLCVILVLECIFDGSDVKRSRCGGFSVRGEGGMLSVSLIVRLPRGGSGRNHTDGRNAGRC